MFFFCQTFYTVEPKENYMRYMYQTDHCQAQSQPLGQANEAHASGRQF